MRDCRVFTFKFDITRDDLRRAYTSNDRKRIAGVPVRMIIVCWGFALIAAFLLIDRRTFAARSVVPPLLLPLFGAFLVWKYLIRPFTVTRALMRNVPPEQAMVLTFDDSGLNAVAEGAGSFRGSWALLESVDPTGEGIILRYPDRSLWIPNRVFESPEQRVSFIAYVQAEMKSVS